MKTNATSKQQKEWKQMKKQQKLQWKQNNDIKMERN